ncbi:MAG: hypothetical protein P4M12_07295 [Gammaproteobacteria bacterium]|nr:hypothetical protein [Gammaproteobacteria bacterium]
MLARFLNSLNKPLALASARTFSTRAQAAQPLSMGITYTAKKAEAVTHAFVKGPGVELEEVDSHEISSPNIKGPGAVVETSVCVEDTLEERRAEIMFLKSQHAAEAEQEAKPAMRR